MALARPLRDRVCRAGGPPRLLYGRDAKDILEGGCVDVLPFCHSRGSRNFMSFHLFTANIGTSEATADITYKYCLSEGDRIPRGVPVPRRLLLLLVRRQVLLQLPAGPQPQGGRRGRVRAVAAKVPRRLKSSDRLPDRSATALGSGIILSM